MIQEISIAEIEKFACLCAADRQLQMVCASIAAGNTHGRLWLEPANPESGALLWDQGNNVFYLAVEDWGGRQAGELERLIQRVIRPEAQARGRRYFGTRLAHGGGEEHLRGLFRGASLEPLSENFYAYEKAQAPSLPPTGKAWWTTPPANRLPAIR